MCTRLIFYVWSSSLRTVHWVVTVCDTPSSWSASSSTIRLQLSIGLFTLHMCINLILCVWPSSLRTVQWMAPSSWWRLLLPFTLSCLSVGWDRTCVCVLSCAYALFRFARFKLMGSSSSTLCLELSIGWMRSHMCMRLILCVWSSLLHTVQWVVTVCDMPSSLGRVLLLFASTFLSVGWDRTCVCVLFCAYTLLRFARFSG
jgi:hypothetical protein